VLNIEWLLSSYGFEPVRRLFKPRKLGSGKWGDGMKREKMADGIPYHDTKE
jgi:hypothetical protein